MAIRTYTIRRYSYKHVILLASSTSLGEALSRISDADDAIPAPYFVISEAIDIFYVATALELTSILASLGKQALSLSLRSLPLREASRVIDADTSESGRDIIEWLNTHAGSSIVVIQENAFVCLFINTHLSSQTANSTIAINDLPLQENVILDESEILTRQISSEILEKVVFQTDVSFPEVIRFNEENLLRVRLMPSSILPTHDNFPIAFEKIYLPESVDVVVTAEDFSERYNKWIDTINVYSSIYSQLAIFILSLPAESNIERTSITVDIYHKNTLINSTKINIEISDELSDGEIRRLPNHLTSVTSFPQDNQPADIELRIRCNNNRLDFEITSAIAGYYHASMGSTQLLSSLDGYIRDLFLELSSSAQRYTHKDEYMLIQTYGEKLFNELFPEQLQSVFWDIQRMRIEGTISSLLIISDEPHIPWELVKPYSQRLDKTDDFLSVAYNLSRWFAGPGLFPSTLRIRSARIIAPIPDILINTSNEIRQFGEFEKLGVTIGKPLQSLEDVFMLFKIGGIQLVHFTSHSHYNENDPDKSSITLSDNQHISPDYVYGSWVKLGKSNRPFFFQNTCGSGRVDYRIVGKGGWPIAFINNANASGYIGTLWNIDDESASIFALHFYQKLIAGQTLGEAFNSARIFTRDNPKRTRSGTADTSNSSWLSYVLYGHPNMRIVFGNQ